VLVALAKACGWGPDALGGARQSASQPLPVCSPLTESLAVGDDDEEPGEEGETLPRANQRPEITVETLIIRCAS
jgi:hypothetical protein